MRSREGPHPLAPSPASGRGGTQDGVMYEKKQPFRGVSRQMRQAARSLRSESTPAESILWEALRGGRLDGLKFRRQHAVGRVVLDFYCASHRLVIELDGAVHEMPDQSERDLARTQWLEEHRCRVIRFRNDEVINDLSLVLERIRRTIRDDVLPLPDSVGGFARPGTCCTSGPPSPARGRGG
jgi:very-short-patch-repair endonuclease